MKKFVFPLANVLKYKERTEEFEKNILNRMHTCLREINDELVVLQQQYNLYRENFLDQSTQGISATELMIGHSYIRELEMGIEEKTREIVAAEAELDRQTQAVVALSQEKKSIELLKDKQLDRYLHQVRREDEIFVEEFVINAKLLTAGDGIIGD